MNINLIGWQSWSDTRRSTGPFPLRNFSPLGMNNTSTSYKLKANSLRRKPAHGWCSWHYFGTDINEEIILSQSQAIIDLDLNLDFVLIDDGWTAWGDWLNPDRRKFPHGLKWLVRQIKSHGLKTGIWWAPLLAKSSSKLFQKHPDWFIPHLEGTKVSPFDIFIPDKRRVLDLQNPHVQKYLDQCLEYFSDIGIKMLKSDFLYANHFNPRLKTSKIPDLLLHQLLAKSYKLKAYSIACGCPLAPAVGVVDAMRISDDINFPQFNRLWPLNQMIISRRISQLEANLKSRLPTRVLWHLDPDAFISDPAFGITSTQTAQLARLIKQANGVVFLGDNLHRVTDNRLLNRLLFTISDRRDKNRFPVLPI